MKIAVIGSGISGLSSAYFLSKKFKVDLYEKADHFGGHSFTYDIKEGDKIVINIKFSIDIILDPQLIFQRLQNFHLQPMRHPNQNKYLKKL